MKVLSVIVVVQMCADHFFSSLIKFGYVGVGVLHFGVPEIPADTDGVGVKAVGKGEKLLGVGAETRHFHIQKDVFKGHPHIVLGGEIHHGVKKAAVKCYRARGGIVLSREIKLVDMGDQDLCAQRARDIGAFEQFFSYLTIIDIAGVAVVRQVRLVDVCALIRYILPDRFCAFTRHKAGKKERRKAVAQDKVDCRGKRDGLLTLYMPGEIRWRNPDIHAVFSSKKAIARVFEIIAYSDIVVNPFSDRFAFNEKSEKSEKCENTVEILMEKCYNIGSGNKCRIRL